MKNLWILMLFLALTAPATTSFAQSKKPAKLWNTEPRSERENTGNSPLPSIGIGNTPDTKAKKSTGNKAGTNSSSSEEAAASDGPLKPINVDKNFKAHARNVAHNCINSWESDGCLTATSESAMVLISQYGAKLQHMDMDEQKEKLKQECAASTAASQKSGFPAYAMKSAYTTCANTIYDIQVTTGINPDPNYYQLLVGTILCMNKSNQCGEIEDGLKKTLL